MPTVIQPHQWHLQLRMLLVVQSSQNSVVSLWCFCWGISHRPTLNELLKSSNRLESVLIWMTDIFTEWILSVCWLTFINYQKHSYDQLHIYPQLLGIIQTNSAKPIALIICLFQNTLPQYSSVVLHGYLSLLQATVHQALQAQYTYSVGATWADTINIAPASIPGTWLYGLGFKVVFDLYQTGLTEWFQAWPLPLVYFKYPSPNRHVWATLDKWIVCWA